MGQRSVPPRAQTDWKEEMTERGRVKTRACRETWLGADSGHMGTVTPSRRLGITPQ